MGRVGLILVLLLGVIFIAVSSEEKMSIKEIVKSCQDADCSAGPHCVGFNTINDNEDNNCNRGVSTQNCSGGSFATFRRLGMDKYRVQLVGHIGPVKNGWIGVYFGYEDETANYEVRVVCLTNGKPKIQQLNSSLSLPPSRVGLVDEPTPTNLDLGGDFRQDTDFPEWMVCEFTMTLPPKDYKIGLLVNTKDGSTVGVGLGAADKKTSSDDKLDFLMALTYKDPLTTGKGGGVGGANKKHLAAGLLALAFFL